MSILIYIIAGIIAFAGLSFIISGMKSIKKTGSSSQFTIASFMSLLAFITTTVLITLGQGVSSIENYEYNVDYKETKTYKVKDLDIKTQYSMLGLVKHQYYQISTPDGETHSIGVDKTLTSSKYNEPTLVVKIKGSHRVEKEKPTPIDKYVAKHIIKDYIYEFDVTLYEPHK